MEYHVITKRSRLGGDRRRGASAAAARRHRHVSARRRARDVERARACAGRRLDRNWVVATQDDAKPIPVRYQLDVGPIDRRPVRDDAPTRLVCGFLGCDLRPFNPLVATPAAPAAPARATQRRRWIGPLMEQAVTESRAAAAGQRGHARADQRDDVRRRGAALRRIAARGRAPAGSPACATATSGRALAAIHEAPVARLDDRGAGGRGGAVALGAARALLAARRTCRRCSTSRTGACRSPPRLLRSSDAPVAAIALDVGYDSEAAFARAFKRLVGMPPATWRRTQREVSRRPSSPAEASASPA